MSEGGWTDFPHPLHSADVSHPSSFPPHSTHNKMCTCCISQTHLRTLNQKCVVVVVVVVKALEMEVQGTSAVLPSSGPVYSRADLMPSCSSVWDPLFWFYLLPQFPTEWPQWFLLTLVLMFLSLTKSPRPLTTGWLTTHSAFLEQWGVLLYLIGLWVLKKRGTF